jgi:intracellular septation protein A
MTLSVVLLGFLPLLIFVIIDSFAGLKAGIIAGVIFALAEISYSLIIHHSIDEFAAGSALLLIFFGFLSYKTSKDIYVKFQPVVVGVVSAVILLVMQLMDKPLLVLLAQRYQDMFPENMRSILLEPANLILLSRLSLVLGWGLFIHAGVVAYAALRLNNWWWLFIRGIGVYIMLFICVLLVKILY